MTGHVVAVSLHGAWPEAPRSKPDHEQCGERNLAADKPDDRRPGEVTKPKVIQLAGLAARDHDVGKVLRVSVNRVLRAGEAALECVNPACITKTSAAATSGQRMSTASALGSATRRTSAE